MGKQRSDREWDFYDLPLLIIMLSVVGIALVMVVHKTTDNYLRSKDYQPCECAPAIVETEPLEPTVDKADVQDQRDQMRVVQVRSCLEDMVSCCVLGDVEAGRVLEIMRIQAQHDIGDESPVVYFDDLFLLSKIIHAEAGADWIPIDWKMKVGEVVLNRTASPEFPDTIFEVVYQKGQYEPTFHESFNSLLPDEASAEAAARLLAGERLINDKKVVFQANFAQGSGVYDVLTDSKLGNTYLCYTNNPDLYEED